AGAAAEARWRGRAGEPTRARGQTLSPRLARRVRRNRWLAAAVVGLLVGGLVGWLVAADAGYAVPGGDAVRTWLDGREASVLRPVPTEHAIQERAQAQRYRLRQNLIGRQFGGGWFGEPGSRPTS